MYSTYPILGEKLVWLSRPNSTNRWPSCLAWRESMRLAQSSGPHPLVFSSSHYPGHHACWHSDSREIGFVIANSLLPGSAREASQEVLPESQCRTYCMPRLKCMRLCNTAQNPINSPAPVLTDILQCCIKLGALNESIQGLAPRALNTQSKCLGATGTRFSNN